MRTLDELVGRTDLLHVKPAAGRAAKLDLEAILHNPRIGSMNVHYQPADTYDFHLERTLDMRVLMKKFKLGSKAPQTVSVEVSNTDRAFGSIFGSEITRRYGNTLPDDTFTVQCNRRGGPELRGVPAQGADPQPDRRLQRLHGQGDVGGQKSWSARPRPPALSRRENIITGNVAFYGATSGKAFLSGVAGERFCVRNSGVTAVVEGVGDHGCEYMTAAPWWCWAPPAKTLRPA